MGWSLFKRVEGGSLLERNNYSAHFHLTETLAGALEYVVRNPRHALIMIKETMLKYPEYKCPLVEAWKTDYPNLLSFAFPKDSRLRVFFNYSLLKHFQRGTLDVLRKRYFRQGLDSCTSQSDQALGFEKTISLFGILAFGFVTAVTLLVLEAFSEKKPSCNQVGVAQVDSNMGTRQWGAKQNFGMDFQQKLADPPKQRKA